MLKKKKRSLLANTTYILSKFRKKNWIEINDDSRGTVYGNIKEISWLLL